MSLLQSLPFKEYQSALKLTTEQCDTVAKLARLKNLQFTDTKKPGELLLKNLDRQGYSLQEYKELISSLSRKKCFYQPFTKVAILIGNDKYIHLPKLVSPPTDCNLLSSSLTNMGFNVILLMNTTAKCLKSTLESIFKVIPEDSYCFIFYAGHGCVIDNEMCLLGVDSPSENIDQDFYVTQNFVVTNAARSNPDLSVVILDMCRINLNSQNSPEPSCPIRDASNHKNLILCYTTQLEQSAYEILQLLDYSDTIDSCMTYELRTQDLRKAVTGGSQYVNALCQHLTRDCDLNLLLDRVHEELESAVKQQKPVKVTFGEGKRSLHDSARGDVEEFLRQLEEIGNSFNI